LVRNVATGQRPGGRGLSGGRPPALALLVVGLVDLALVHGGLLLALAVRSSGTFPDANLNAYRIAAPGITMLVVVLFLAYGLYDLRPQSWRNVASGLGVATLLLPPLVMALTFAVRAFAFPRTVAVLAWPPILGLLLLWRYLVWLFLARIRGLRTAIVVGPQLEALRLAQSVDHRGPSGYSVVAVAFEGGEGDIADVAAGSDAAPERVGTAGPNVPRFPESVLADQILSATQSPPDVFIVASTTSRECRVNVVALAARIGSEVIVVPSHEDLLVAHSRMTQLDDMLAFEIDPPGVPSHLAWAKRLMDMLVSALGILIALPAGLIVALGITLSSPGPVLYTQTRVGMGGRLYTLLKFRTMTADAEGAGEAVLSVRDDPRVTRFGRVLRRHRLDELPQLVNVLLGSMSLVGPRPERLEFMGNFARTVPLYDYRHRLRPGLTGLAQLYARYDTPAAEKLRYDLLYAKRYSLLLDLRVLLLTAKVVLRGEEAHWRARDRQSTMPGSTVAPRPGELRQRRSIGAS